MCENRYETDWESSEMLKKKVFGLGHPTKTRQLEAGAMMWEVEQDEGV